MRIADTRRFRYKGKYILVVVVDQQEQLQKLKKQDSVVVMARRDLVALQRALKGVKQPVTAKIRNILTLLTRKKKRASDQKESD